jgi:hypothetical protein
MSIGYTHEQATDKKNLHAHVLLVPAAHRLDEYGFELPAIDDPWWLIEEVTDVGITISDPRSGHVKALTYDQLHKWTNDTSIKAAKRGLLSLHVQLTVQGNAVSVMPNARPSEPVPVKQPQVVEKLVEFGYPVASGIQQRYKTQGYELKWCRPEYVHTKVDIDGCAIVIEPIAPGRLSTFRTRDGQVLIKCPRA